MNFVTFADDEGQAIPSLTAYLDGTVIRVSVPRTVDPSAKITATFNLTQAGGYPKLPTSNSFNRTNDTKVYTTTLSGGAGKATMYLYTSAPTATNNRYTTYTIEYATANDIPVLTGASSKQDTGTAGTAYYGSYGYSGAPVVPCRCIVTVSAGSSGTTNTENNQTTEKEPTQQPVVTFTDVKETNYFYTAVKWAVGNGITNGTSENTFSPEAVCSRGQMVTFLYRLVDEGEN